MFAKLTDDQVREIRASYPQFTQKALAQRYGVVEQTIQHIVHRRRYKGVK